MSPRKSIPGETSACVKSGNGRERDIFTMSLDVSINRVRKRYEVGKLVKSDLDHVRILDLILSISNGEL